MLRIPVATCLLLTVLACAGDSARRPDETRLVRLKGKLGYSVELPQGWLVLSADAVDELAGDPLFDGFGLTQQDLEDVAANELEYFAGQVDDHSLLVRVDLIRTHVPGDLACRLGIPSGCTNRAAGLMRERRWPSIPPPTTQLDSNQVVGAEGIPSERCRGEGQGPRTSSRPAARRAGRAARRRRRCASPRAPRAADRRGFRRAGPARCRVSGPPPAAGRRAPASSRSPRRSSGLAARRKLSGSNLNTVSPWSA